MRTDHLTHAPAAAVLVMAGALTLREEVAMVSQRIRGVVVDLWRTIVDPCGDRFVERVAAVLQSRGHVSATDDDVTLVLDAHGHLRRARSLDEMNADVWHAFTGTHPNDEVVEVLRNEHRRFVDGARMIPGADDFLGGLQRRGIEVAVVSNATVASDDVVERLGLSGIVADIALSCHTGYAKPDPRAIRVVTDRWGFDHREVCVVGDKWETDIAGAEFCGMPSVKIGGRARSEPGLIGVARDIGGVAALLDAVTRAERPRPLTGARA